VIVDHCEIQRIEAHRKKLIEMVGGRRALRGQGRAEREYG
jgi:hypothetical protein